MILALQISEDFPEQFITSLWNHVAAPVMGALPQDAINPIIVHGYGFLTAAFGALGIPLF